MSKRLTVAFVALTASAAGAASAEEPVTVQIRPAAVLVERSGERQLLNFELELTNGTPQPLEIQMLLMRGYDKGGRLLVWQKLDSNGSRPSLEALGLRRVEPGHPLTVFNPFYEVDTAVPLDVLRYEFRLAGPGGARARATAEVRPTEYVQKTKLILPVAGAHLWAYEGPDFYSHHRRVDLADPFVRDVLKVRRNAQRFALDLVVVDEAGEAFHDDAAKKENWIGFGTPVVAPGAGTVVALANDQPDELEFDEAVLQKDPKAMIGNYVVIDHGNGEFSALAHFRRGSLAVKVGDRVRPGQPLGAMGRSGMGSGLVHVHYELATTADLMDGDGLPARFDGFRRIGSDRLESGGIEPGWIVIAAPGGQE